MNLKSEGKAKKRVKRGKSVFSLTYTLLLIILSCFSTTEIPCYNVLYFQEKKKIFALTKVTKKTK